MLAFRRGPSIAVLLAGVLLAAVGRLLDGSPTSYVGVRWHFGIEESARRELEVRFSLLERTHDGWMFRYELLDDSTSNVRELVRHPWVDDIHDIDRRTFRVAATATRGERRTGLAWRWGFHERLPWLNWFAGALIAIGLAGVIATTRWTRTVADAVTIRLVIGARRSLVALKAAGVATIARARPMLSGGRRRLEEFYRLPPAVPPTRWPGRDRALLLACGITLQIVLLLAIFLGFECDAATFYSFAKAISGQGGAFSATRAPLYPAFLVLTGTVWPGTFVGVVLAQAAMGIAMPLLVYRILSGVGRRPALIGAFAILLSTTPFVGAKLILAEQLYAFLTILTIYFLARYHDQQDPRAIYYFVFAGLGAMLTRWEAEILFVVCTCAIVALAVSRRRQIRHLVVALGIAVLALGGYSAVRAFALGDVRLIGTLQSGAGFQLFNRLYTMNRDRSASKFGLSVTVAGESDFAVAAANPRLVGPANGPASRQLRDVVATFARDAPEVFRSLKYGLRQLHREADAPPDPYEELFGRFEGSPDALADYIFRCPMNFRTAQYSLYVGGAAHHVLGLEAGDRLMLAAALETIRTYPGVIPAMFAEGSTLIGISPKGIPAMLQDPRQFENWIRMYPVWGVPGYTHVDFNVGGCAAIALPPRMMAEYQFDHGLTNTDFARTAGAVAGIGRNIVRACCGTILFLGWWLLLIAPRRAVNVPMLVAVGSLILIVGISVGGGNSKYDIGFMPLLVMTAVAVGAECGRRVMRHPIAERRDAVLG